LLGLVLLALAARLVISDPRPLQLLAETRLSTAAAIVLLIVFNQWLTAWRFQLVVRRCAGIDVPRTELFRLSSVGQFLNLFVPQLGNVYRAWALARQYGLTYGDFAIGASLFFWFEMLTGLGLACVVVALQDPSFRLGPIPVLVPLAVGFMLLLSGPPLAGAIVPLIPLGSGGTSRVIRTVGSLFIKARISLTDSAFVLRYVAVNLVVAAVHAAILWLAFYTVGGLAGFGRLMLFQVLLKLTSLVNVTPGNIGLTELAYGVLAEAASGGAQRGIAAALLIRGLGTPVTVALGVALGGTVFLRREGRNRIKGQRVR
jgi:uncharacterized membrane protein YbhN (UPF0104 family)